ncbi:MAG: hypothetical protein JWN41_95 [Thermoleophilia bacterium]|nr:hypothetical protein [Thermoleophilia bacterium]
MSHISKRTAALAALSDSPALQNDPRPGTVSLANTALGALGIELLIARADRVVMRMCGSAVNAPSALLVLAESAASTAAGIAAGCNRRAFGAELDGTWLNAADSRAVVLAEAEPLALTHTRHTWRICIASDDATPLFEGRCTLSVVDSPTTAS